MTRAPLPNEPVSADMKSAVSDTDVVEAVGTFSEPVARAELERALGGRIGLRALRSRLSALVRSGRLVKLGDRRWTTYALPDADDGAVHVGAESTGEGETLERSLSAAGRTLLERLSRPVSSRPASGYRSGYVDAYVPGTTRWLSDAERERLHRMGTVSDAVQPAGTYARNILDRLLIDLSFNSSRLESNTYSLLDTRRLLELGVEAPGHDPREAQMIRNHRDAIEFLVENADETGFDRRTILNLHALLANELLPDPLDAGRLRTIPVAIGQSTYLPEAVPQVIESAFAELLERIARIDDPFEQALVTLAHVPYLQPFVDVSKRVSRLAANIPLIRANLVPVSFVGVPRQLYAKAVLAVYEFEEHTLLKELFLWAHERSVRRYTDVRQSLEMPDPFRTRYRDALAAFVADAVRRRIRLRQAATTAATWAIENVPPADRERFAELAEGELMGLHEGNFARFRLRPSEFDAWALAQEDDLVERLGGRPRRGSS